MVVFQSYRGAVYRKNVMDETNRGHVTYSLQVKLVRYVWMEEETIIFTNNQIEKLNSRSRQQATANIFTSFKLQIAFVLCFFGGTTVMEEQLRTALG